MITIDDILSEENQTKAMEALLAKRDGAGPDGLRISEFADYWKANGARIEASIRNGAYRPSIVKVFEIVDNHGKQRGIASINVLDRYIERLIQQALRREIEPAFLSNSFAYQAGKGTLDAAMLARSYIESGCRWLCEIDIKDCFGSISIGRALDAFKEHVNDEVILALLKSLLFRQVEQEGKVMQLKRGLLQGSALSPIICNIYLHPLDS